MYPNNEGPQQVNIPQQSFTSCSGCKYHTHKLVRSGRDPKYRDDCTHPDNGQDKAFKLSFTGNLQANFAGVIVTPDWCPFKKKVTPKEQEPCKHDGKINQGHHPDQPSYCDNCGEEL